MATLTSRLQLYLRFRERQRDPSLLSVGNFDDSALHAVVRVAEHEAGGVNREELRQRPVLSEGGIVDQDVLLGGLQRERLGRLRPLLLQGDLAMLAAHVLETLTGLGIIICLRMSDLAVFVYLIHCSSGGI